MEYLDAHPPELIIVAAKGRFIVADSTGKQFTADADSARFASTWRRGAESTLRRLSRHSKVLLVRDVPLPGFNVSICIERNIDDPAKCSFARAKAVAGPPWGEDARVADAISGVRLLDLSDEMCEGAQCSAIIGGAVTYRDGNHLTAQFARSLAHRFELEFTRLLHQ